MHFDLVVSFANFVLALSMIYHGTVGIFATLSVSVTRKIGRFLYNLDIPERLDPRYEYALKPIGGYAIFVAAVSAYGIYSQNLELKKVSCVLVGLLIFSRGVQRLVFASLVQRAFSVSKIRNRVHAGINFALAFLFGLAAALV